MLVVALSFPAGRYHATAWGRHVNEADPEWPPSPYRLVRALFDAWKRKRSAIPQDRVEALFRALCDRPPSFCLPPASASHTRSFLSSNQKDPSAKSLIFDGFVVVARDRPVLVGWPDVTLSSEEAADLFLLLEVLNYLGRSESWVEARLLPDAADLKWNCVPAGSGSTPQGYETVRVALPVPEREYAPPPMPRRRGRVQTKPLQWFDALAFSTEDLLQARSSEPPALLQAVYLRPEQCLTVVPVPKRRARASAPCGVLFTLESKVLPRVTETLDVAERIRTKCMGIHRRICGKPELVSPKFSGKDAEGNPLSGHRHAFFLPMDCDSDGRLDHLLVICADPLDEREVLALDRLQTIWQADGRPDIRLTPLMWGGTDRLVKRSTVLVSATPYVPVRHYRKGRGEFSEWLAEEVRRECELRGLPLPARVLHQDRLRLAGGRSLRWLDFRRNRKKDDSRLGYGLRLEFAEPVAAPLALGYGCHFGLGAFRPLEE